MLLVNLANLLELLTVPVNEKFPFRLCKMILYHDNAVLCSRTVPHFCYVLKSVLRFVYIYVLNSTHPQLFLIKATVVMHER